MIKLIILDVDGTLTDGKLYYSPSGEMMKAFNVKDGYAIKKALNVGKIIVVATARESKIVEFRCNELGITELYQNVSDKMQLFNELIEKYNLDPKTEVAYIGDDLVDYLPMRSCGMKGAPKNATYEILDIADFISSKVGGEGAVREFIELILKREKLWTL